MKPTCLSLFFLILFPFALMAQSDFVSISNGNDYLCAHNGEKVSCWGKNDYGQSQEIDGFLNIREVKTSGTFACASDDLGLSCWGLYPELTLEMQSASHISKLEVAGQSVCILVDGVISCAGKREAIPEFLNHVSDFSISNARSCAIQDGKVSCWGVGYHSIPQDLGFVVKIDIQDTYACVLNRDQKLRCWGEDTSEMNNLPTQMGKVVDFQTGFSHGCLVNDEGKLLCWGSQSDGLGHAPQYGGIKALSVGRMSNCLLQESGEINCWGYGAKELKLPPVVNNPDFFAATASNTCFIAQGKLACSGTNPPTSGRTFKNVTSMVGRYKSVCAIDENGPHCMSSTFDSVPGELKVASQISIAEDHLCAIMEEGRVGCWKPEDPVINYKELQGVVKLSSGKRQTCALTEKNEVQCWGMDSSNPQLLPGLQVKDIASGYYYDCLLYENDQIQCWMGPGYGGGLIMKTPDYLVGMKGLVSGDDFACAYGEDFVSCWGDPRSGKLAPPKIVGKIKSVSAGNDHACFQDEERIKCWGDNTEGNYQFLQ